jgi:hypothetical protein
MKTIESNTYVKARIGKFQVTLTYKEATKIYNAHVKDLETNKEFQFNVTEERNFIYVSFK